MKTRNDLQRGLRSSLMPTKPVPFDDAKAIAAAKNARGFHEAARVVDESFQSMARVAGRESQSAGVMEQIVGQASAVAILDALALELTLKVRLHRAGKPVPATHDHRKLFEKLTDTEKHDLERRYAERRHLISRTNVVVTQSASGPGGMTSVQPPASRLEEALSRSGSVFVTWRYMFEHPVAIAYTSEMMVAYDVLQEGL